MPLDYHLAPDAWYHGQDASQPYQPEEFDRAGFIHLTHGIEATLAAGNRSYTSDSRAYVLLTVDLDRVTAEVRYEDTDQRYPHVYGVLDRAAIIEIHRVNRGPDGRFLGVGGALPGHTETGR